MYRILSTSFPNSLKSFFECFGKILSTWDCRFGVLFNSNNVISKAIVINFNLPLFSPLVTSVSVNLH